MNFSVCLFVFFFKKGVFRFRGIILWWHRPAEALDVRKKTWCTRKICVNNLRFFHITYGNTYRYRCTKRRFTASRLLSATLVVMTRIRKILDEKTAFFAHVSLGAILCDFLKSIFLGINERRLYYLVISGVFSILSREGYGVAAQEPADRREKKAFKRSHLISCQILISLVLVLGSNI